MRLPPLPDRLRPRLPRRRGPLVGLGAGVLVGVLTVTGVLPALATVMPPLPDVLIRKLALDLAFGPAPTPPEPSSTSTPAVAVHIPPAIPEPRETPSNRPTPPFVPPPIVTVACDLDTTRPVFPTDPLSTAVSGRPAAGTYTWRHEGEFTIGAGDAAITAPLLGFTERRIGQLDVADDGSFAYTYWTRFTFFRQVERIRVAPGDGIYLERLERRTAKDEAFLVFEPLMPVKIVSLPIPLSGIETHSLVDRTLEEQLDDPDDPEDPWDFLDQIRNTETSAGTDPVNRMSLVVQSSVVGHERVNACGHLADAYVVSGTRTFSRDTTGDLGGGPDAGQAVERFEFAIAPQLGALLLRERFVTETPGFIGPLPYQLDATFTAGTLTPDGGLDGVEDEDQVEGAQ